MFGLPSVIFAVTHWGNTGRIGLLVTAAAGSGVAALVALVVHSRRVRDPLLDLSLYRNRLYRAATLASLSNGALVFGTAIVVTLYFELGRGTNTIDAGMSLIGYAGAGSLAAPLVGRVIDRWGAAGITIIGGVLAVVTAVPLAMLPLDAPIPLVQTLLAVLGAAVTMVAMPAGIAAFATVSPDQLPDATTQVNIVQRGGGSFGGAVFSVLIAARLPDTTAAFHAGLLGVSLAAIGALFGALLIRQATPKRTRPTQ